MARRKKKTKIETLRDHTKRRAKERYGINWNRHIEREAREQIHRGDSVFVERQSNRISVHRVLLEDQWVTLVWDKIRFAVVTVLPKDADPNDRGEYVEDDYEAPSVQSSQQWWDI